MQKFKIFSSFRTKVTLALILVMIFVSMISNLLVYRYALKAQFEGLRDKLIAISQTAALMVDADLLKQISLDKAGMNSPQFKLIAENLEKVKSRNKSVKYIYVMSKTDQEGIWQFIVDPDLSSFPGATYDARRFPEMLKGFEGPAADTKLEVDEWGATLSGYAPIRDKTGKAVAMLGVDMAAQEVVDMRREIDRRVNGALLLGVIISLAVGYSLSRMITKPIAVLVKGTQIIAKGNLKYQVEVKGDDEIAGLSKSFNEMAGRLNQAREKLQRYFYHVVVSLVRILEAKDVYTKGHSERVAEYALKIASKIGFSEEQIEVLKETAILHDIGKLGIKESILNKESKLSDEEIEIIHKHPVIGGQILEPVVLAKEMLDIVRGHHERYDGLGYPDKLSGESINIFAQIVSVADAYDAMTSTRSYRHCMDKAQAIAELKKNSGTQFNPKVVEAFLAILKEELGS